MMRLPPYLQKYLLGSSLLIVFSEAAVVHTLIDVKLFYAIMAINFPLLLCCWNWKLKRGYLLIIGLLWFMGAMAILRGTDTVSAFLQQAVGITLCSLYFHLFFSNTSYSVKSIVRLYVACSYWVAVLGLVLSAIITAIDGKYFPVQSILTEPAHFCTAVMPALYFSLSEAIWQRREKRRAFVLFLAVAMSGSSTGFFGIFVTGLLLARRRPLISIVVAGFMALAGLGLYTFDTHFRVRIDDTISGANGFDLSGGNLTSYAFLSNLYVSWHAFQDHPIAGYGPGAHQIAHEKYIGDLPALGSLEQYIETDKRDANSLFLRITSEFGLAGLALVAWFLKRFSVPAASDNSEMSAAITTYLAMKLLREGHWFSPEMYFFVWLYVLVCQESRLMVSASQAPAAMVMAPSCNLTS